LSSRQKSNLAKFGPSVLVASIAITLGCVYLLLSYFPQKPDGVITVAFWRNAAIAILATIAIFLPMLLFWFRRRRSPREEISSGRMNLNLVKFSGWVLIALGIVTFGTVYVWFILIGKNPMASFDIMWRNTAVGIILLISGAVPLLWAKRKERRNGAHVRN
jgi:hypothetical protein